MRRLTRRLPIARPGLGSSLARGLLAIALVGCGAKEENPYKSVETPPSVRLIQPQKRSLVRTVGQPSFVEAYERTSIYPKMTAYIKDWAADIGDRVRKDDVLATLFVPELEEDHATKGALVKLDEQRVRLAEQVVLVAQADVKAAAAGLEEAKKILGKYEAEVERWDTEVKRLKREVDRGVVDPQILLESTNQLKSSTAARDAASATIDKARAELDAAEEALAKDKVDVAVAQANLAVATSEWRRVGALVGYLSLRAPFDGVVYERNANTFDFVLPATGDPTANRRAPDVSSAGAAPIYVVDRTDIVRIFVDIPERDANFVHGIELRLLPAPKALADLPAQGRDLVVLARLGGGLHFRVFDSEGKSVLDADERTLTEKKTQLDELKRLLADQWDRPNSAPPATPSPVIWDKIPGGARQLSPLVKTKALDLLAAMHGRDKVPGGTRAEVLVRAYRDEPIAGSVTRTSWALNVTSRTLRAEIDLPNPGGQLLPGMYAYANVIIEHQGAMALPESALSRVGDRAYCWLLADQKAHRVEARTGVSDGQWTEISAIQTRDPSKTGDTDSWTPLSGSERIITGDLSTLTEGATVQVDSTPVKSAGDTSNPKSPADSK